MLNVHFLGIGGSGASAAAAIAQAQGFEVTGCDLVPNNEFTTIFRPTQLLKGHSASHLTSGNVDILAVTPAIYSLDPKNPEILEAKKKGIPIMTWQQFMGKYLMKDKFVIAVAGTHGKTTTTAMIARIMEDSGLDPTVLLGAIVPLWKTNYRIGHSKYFIVEADEFNDNFLEFTPDISVVTSIEVDHPEYFKDLEAVKKSFRKFMESTKQTIVANLSDPGVNQTLNAQTGFGDSIEDYSKHLIEFPLQIPGEFNNWNASAAYQVGILLGIKPDTIRKSLASYKGISRRFEYLGKFKGAEIYTDFGHHPTEIKTTMQAAREKYPSQKIWLIYEPHMFTRTKALFADFVKVFKGIMANNLVDRAIITDIYPSREVNTGLISSKDLVDTIHDDTLVYHSKAELKNVLTKQIQKGDILFFMGAGDIDKIAKELVE